MFGWFFVIFHNFRKLFLVKTFLEYSLLKCYSCIKGNQILYLSFQRIIPKYFNLKTEENLWIPQIL